MHKLSDIINISDEIIKEIGSDFEYNDLKNKIIDIFSNHFTNCEKTEQIKILKHIIAYSDYNISDYMTYISYFALVFAAISIIPGEVNFCSIAITIFMILLPFFIIFKKTKENNKFYILKTIALDRVEELEKRSAGIKEPE